MIEDAPEPGGPLGFLHDFESSFMTDFAPGDSQPGPSGLNTAHADDELKEKRVSILQPPILTCVNTKP